MMKIKLFVTIFIGLVMSIEAEKKGETAAPTPSLQSVDCSTVMYDMLDCIPYLSVGSRIGKVESSCCSGLESVLSVDSSCLCVGLKESVALGLNLNFTKALHLPSDCHLSVSPSVTHCSVSSSSSSSPSPSSPHMSHPQLSPKFSPSHVAPSIAKSPVSAPKSSFSSSPAPSASPKKAPIIMSQTTVPAPAPAKSSGSSSIKIISIINLVLIIITMMIN